MAALPERPESWIRVCPEGLFVEPAGIYIDPVRPVDRAVVTHAHADHARPGNRAVLATAETLAIMRQRIGPAAGQTQQAVPYGEVLRLGEVDVALVPAGHVLGSAQVVLTWRGRRVVVSGDYKRRLDPTCAPFEPVPCDLFVSEATFGLPVFRHPPTGHEIAKLVHSLALFPERAHVVGVYALGKCQRLIAELRGAGFDDPIYLHGALVPICAIYESFGVPMGELRPALAATREEMRGRVVLAPPSAIADRWARRLPDPVTAMASGWMRVRQRARQRGIELPLVISDHADWDELTETITELGARQLWVTHGNEEPLVHWARGRGIAAEALALVGFDEGGEGEPPPLAGEEEPPTGDVLPLSAPEDA
ncbi:ligase-associated DNA damage response exonuclease [Arenibaculum pallidiluteum]|uniref:ligase-associated DNA damage response exonuclease n=1 Tax=Arenibaculum pallidiluteum TaxID=2812559 RepID=UPI001A97BB26|nr:ligase-associated DNA damage response exonuclease [Arenibaculum pallidiluteum]